MLELKGIRKTFNPNSPLENKVIANLNLTINERDFITVIGGNGAGKSTMLNIISGAIEADQGLILLNGYDISNLSEHKRAAYFGRVFQDPMMGSAADMTILENLSIAYGRGKIHSLFRWSTTSKEKAYFKELLKSLDLGLEDRINQKVGLLSGGQRQALTLLMATVRKTPSRRIIIREYIRFMKGDYKQISYVKKSKYKKDVKNAKNDPDRLIELAKVKEENKIYLSNLKKELISLKKQLNSEFIAAKHNNSYQQVIEKYDVTKQILLLDEHTAALDPKTAQKVLDITDRIVNENHLTTIMITHNMKDAIKYGNRLIMMSKGKVVVDVSGEEKQKLTVDDLLDLFTKSSKDDFLSDEAILGD